MGIIFMDEFQKEFKLNSDFKPLGDQPQAISSLVNGKVRLFTKEIANDNFAKFFIKENEKNSVFSYQINKLEKILKVKVLKLS